GKIMMVLSDGSPAGGGNSRDLEYHLKEVVKKIEKSKVDVIGIGIEDDSVRRFYDKHVVIHDVEQLPSLVAHCSCFWCLLTSPELQPQIHYEEGHSSYRHFLVNA
ncbi:hypothetical protein OYB56_09220, partial [Acinetobacter baumannii]|uniref:cobaltochelatase CobT-related protein n=1 Tax=Acinetobacter baumannii TaxID=470 RepID=UPI00229114E9|nr:hypothetical protein [Acinetobacter baumannii]